MQQKLELKDLAWPIFVENFLARAMGMVNIYLISSYSEEAVAAVGVSNQLINFINMMFYFVTLGSAIIISQNLGAGNRERAAAASSIAVFLNLTTGLAMGLTVLFFHRPLLGLMGLSGQAMSYAALYFSIIGGLCALQGFNFSLGTIMRNYGQAKTPMLIFLGMNLLNLVGNSIIVLRPFGLPDFGIGGIAACTVLAQATAAVVMLASAIRFKIRLRLAKPFPFSMLRDVLKVGIPGAGDSIAYSIAMISLTYFVTSLGTTALASFTYAQSLIAFVQLMGFAVGQSSQILVGRYAGARRFDQAYRLAFRSTWLAMALNMSVMIALFIFQRPVLGLFTQNPAIFTIVFWCFVIDLVLEVGRPFNLVIGSCVRGSGDVKWAIVASSASLLLVCIPLGYLLTQVIPLGVPGVFIALCVDEWLRGQLMTWRWRSRKWELSVLIKEKSGLENIQTAEAAEA